MKQPEKCPGTTKRGRPCRNSRGRARNGWYGQCARVQSTKRLEDMPSFPVAQTSLRNPWDSGGGTASGYFGSRLAQADNAADVASPPAGRVTREAETTENEARSELRQARCGDKAVVKAAKVRLRAAKHERKRAEMMLSSASLSSPRHRALMASGRQTARFLQSDERSSPSPACHRPADSCEPVCSVFADFPMRVRYQSVQQPGIGSRVGRQS